LARATGVKKCLQQATSLSTIRASTLETVQLLRRSVAPLPSLTGLLDSALNHEKRQMGLGMGQVARERDIKLLYIAGGRFDTPRPVT
jgi:hypothetical protein